MNRQGVSPGVGHNGGPPLETRSSPPWGLGQIGTFFEWKAAHNAAWRKLSRETILRRLERAERIGLSFHEYTLEILERGRYLSLPDDAARIAEIKATRRTRKRR